MRWRRRSEWTQTILVTGLADGPAFSLFCEPEGAEHEVLPGDVLTIRFTAATPHLFEVTSVAKALILCRYGDSDVTIEDKRGRTLRW